MTHPTQPASAGWECFVPHSNSIFLPTYSDPFNLPCDSKPCLLLSLLLLSRMHNMKAAVHSGSSVLSSCCSFLAGVQMKHWKFVLLLMKSSSEVVCKSYFFFLGSLLASTCAEFLCFCPTMVSLQCSASLSACTVPHTMMEMKTKKVCE